MKRTWIVGPPPRRGAFWIVWYGKVVLVDIGPALIHAGIPGAPPLLKLLGGVAYMLDDIKSPITHHMPIDVPEAP